MTPLPPAEFMRDKTREEIEAELVAMLRGQRADKPRPDQPSTLSDRVFDTLLTIAAPRQPQPTGTSVWESIVGGSDGDGGGDGGGGD